MKGAVIRRLPDEATATVIHTGGGFFVVVSFQGATGWQCLSGAVTLILEQQARGAAAMVSSLSTLRKDLVQTGWLFSVGVVSMLLH